MRPRALPEPSRHPPVLLPSRSHLAALQGAFPEQNPHFRSGFSLLLLLCSVLVGAKFTPGMFLFKQTLKHEAASCIFCFTVITKTLSWGHTLPSQAPSPSPRQAHTHSYTQGRTRFTPLLTSSWTDLVLKLPHLTAHPTGTIHADSGYFVGPDCGFLSRTLTPGQQLPARRAAACPPKAENPIWSQLLLRGPSGKGGELVCKRWLRNPAAELCFPSEAASLQEASRAPPDHAAPDPTARESWQHLQTAAHGHRQPPPAPRSGLRAVTLAGTLHGVLRKKEVFAVKKQSSRSSSKLQYPLLMLPPMVIEGEQRREAKRPPAAPQRAALTSWARRRSAATAPSAHPPEPPQLFRYQAAAPGNPSLSSSSSSTRLPAQHGGQRCRLAPALLPRARSAPTGRPLGHPRSIASPFLLRGPAASSCEISHPARRDEVLGSAPGPPQSPPRGCCPKSHRCRGLALAHPRELHLLGTKPSLDQA